MINLELEEHLSAVQISKIKELLGLIKGIARVTADESHQLAALHTPESKGRLVLPQGQKQEIDLDHINPRQKKHIISQAIAWGSKQGKITLSVLERLTPEELLGLATRFLSEMPDHEKDVIFREMT